MESGFTRRDFLRGMVLAGGGLALSGCTPLFDSGKSSSSSGGGDLPAPRSMPYRAFGATGEPISLLGLGGEAAVEGTNQDLAVRIVNEAINRGINYLDTSWYYNGGQSERNIGQVMPTRREEVFLATKSAKRSYSGVMSDIDDSLRRLNTDHVDLYQLHDVRTSSDLSQVFGDGGAVQAMESLRDQGVVRFIGITGHHDPQILLEAINQYPFDAILLSLNAADRWYLPFQQELLQAASDKNMATVAMKVAAKGRIIGEGKLTIQQAMSYVYSFPVSCAIMGISSLDELAEDIGITENFQPLSSAELEQLELATQTYQEESGNWFKMGYEEV